MQLQVIRPQPKVLNNTWDADSKIYIFTPKSVLNAYILTTGARYLHYVTHMTINGREKLIVLFHATSCTC